MELIKNLLAIVAGVPAILRQNARLHQENDELKKQLADFQQLKDKEAEIQSVATDVGNATFEPSQQPGG